MSHDTYHTHNLKQVQEEEFSPKQKLEWLNESQVCLEQQDKILRLLSHEVVAYLNYMHTLNGLQEKTQIKCCKFSVRGAIMTSCKK